MYDDHKVHRLSEEDMIKHSMGGIDNRSAFWLVYISEESRSKYCTVDQNRYDQIDPTYNIQLHEYGNLMKQALIQVEESKN